MIAPMNISTFILFLGLIHLAHSKGARGGSSSGGRASGYRGSYSYRGSSYRATNLRTWSTSQKSAAIALGSVYISSRMRARYGSPDYYDNHDVTICQNVEKYPAMNGSTTVYGWFLCPVEKDENSYCCGSSNEQYCCDYWSSPNAVGAYIGFAFLGAGVIAGVIVFILCCLKSKCFQKSRPSQSQVGDRTVSFSSQPVAAASNGDNGNPPDYSYINPMGPNEKNEFSSQQQYGLYPPPYSPNGGAAPS